MIAYRKKVIEARCERGRRGGRRSQAVQSERRMQREIGPRPLPYGKLLRVFMSYDPVTDRFIRYEIYKSFAGKRKVDVVVNGSIAFRGRSVTWLFDRLRRKMAMLPEIVED